MESDSVTTWIAKLKAGTTDKAQQIWERYVDQLVRLARRKLAASSNRVADEEDAIIDAFDSFFRGVQEGRFAKLEDRDDLWQILVMLTDRKVIDQRRREQTQKRGGGHLRGESVFEKPGQERTPAGGLHCVPDDGPSPEFAEQSAEELRRLLDLLDEQLQQVALLKLQNLTNDEIARQLSVTPRTVERRLSLIRQFWEGEIGGGERL